MNPQAAAVDETLSFAHRDREGVRVTLRIPGSSLAPGDAEVGLTTGKRRFRVPAAVTSDDLGATVTFTAPGARLRQAVWSLELRSPGGGPAVPVMARLLARRDQPVALLPGPVPTTSMPAPRPRPPRSLARRAAGRLPAPVRRALRRLAGRSSG
jgi:hypothetical protein